MNAQTEPCAKLPWDSAFFGAQIARVQGSTLDETRAAAVDAWCAREKTACVYFLAEADDPATAQCAAAHGFALVEVRMEFERRGTSGTPAESVRPVAPADLPALEAIARSSFTDSRFYVDGHFPRQRCDDLYARWIGESCRPGGFADAVLVAECEGVPAAFITCKREENGRVGRIGLVGVDRRFRGRGLGRCITGAALNWFENQGASCVRVVTQGRNIASQRLYQRCGFLTHAVGLYFHKWYP